MVDVRFASATQLMLSLCLAAREGLHVVPSAELAEGLGTNPSLVRKQLAPLLEAGLLRTTKGAHGGVSLARAPEEITLADVYRAVLAERPLFATRTDYPRRCVVSNHIESLFDDVGAELDDVVTGSLERRTLASCLAEMQKKQRPARR